MLLYEIADDVHWLMLTDVKHIKKSVVCPGLLCTLTNATYEQTADLSLYTWYMRTCIIHVEYVDMVACISVTIMLEIEDGAKLCAFPDRRVPIIMLIR